MTKFKPAAVAVLMTAVVGGSIAFTLQQASASAHPGIASVWVDQTLGFAAGTGTVNTVEVKPLSGGGFTFADATGTIELKSDAGFGCVQTNSHMVTCTAAVKATWATLADGNDHFNNSTNLTANAYGGDGDDELLGGGGMDQFYGDAGKDLLAGGYGDDILEGGPGVDTVYGQAGNDSLTSADHLDALWGSSGNDTLRGGATMHGDDNNDILYPVLGGEHWGGTEYDVVDFSQWSETVHVSLDGNQNDGNASADPTSGCGSWLGGCIPDPMNVHGDVEKIVGTAYDDVIIGNDNDNAIDAGAGNDAIDGRGGNDYLDVEGGASQRVHGGSGNNDTCVGFGITVRDGCEH
jgi:Ca2+-binding RTX toxin-like protein